MIRQGTLHDAAQIAEIFNHYVRTSPVIFSERELTATEMRSRLEQPLADGLPFYVSLSDDCVTGYCYAHRFMPDPVYGRTLEITVYLAPQATGRGIGTQLLRRVIADCRAAGAHTLVSFVTAGNIACERLHRRCGFTAAGLIREAGFKLGRYWDDLILQLLL